MNKIILFMYRESSGELNVALPIIKFIKENYTIESTHFYFNSRKDFDKLDSSYKHIITNIGKKYTGTLGFYELLKNISNKKIFLFTSDKGPKLEISFLQEIFNSVTTIMTMHAPVILYRDNNNEKNDNNNSIYREYKVDYFFDCNKIDYENKYFSKNKYSIPEEKIKLIGSLSYKSEWINYIINLENINPNIELFIKKFEKIILVPTRGPHKKYLTHENYIYQINTIINLSKKYTNYGFIIKPHPREKEKIYKQYISKSSSNILLSTENIFCLSNVSNLVISFWSSIIQDVALTNTPVVEFHRHTQVNDELIKVNNKFVSYYSYFDFCKHIDNEKDLELFINNHFNNANNINMEDEKKKIKSLFLIDDEIIKKEIKPIFNSKQYSLKEEQKTLENFFKYIKKLLLMFLYKKVSKYTKKGN